MTVTPKISPFSHPIALLYVLLPTQNSSWQQFTSRWSLARGAGVSLTFAFSISRQGRQRSSCQPAGGGTGRCSWQLRHDEPQKPPRPLSQRLAALERGTRPVVLPRVLTLMWKQRPLSGLQTGKDSTEQEPQQVRHILSAGSGWAQHRGCVNPHSPSCCAPTPPKRSFPCT